MFRGLSGEPAVFHVHKVYSPDWRAYRGKISCHTGQYAETKFLWYWPVKPITTVLPSQSTSLDYMVGNIHWVDTEMRIVVSLAMGMVLKLFYISLAKTWKKACLVLASCCLMLLQTYIGKEKIPIVHMNGGHLPNLI